MPNDHGKADPDITVADELDPEDVAVITDGLVAYDLNQAGHYDFRPMAVFVRDPQTGKVIGGLHGRSEFGLVYVAWLFLPEHLRVGRLNQFLPRITKSWASGLIALRCSLRETSAAISSASSI